MTVHDMVVEAFAHPRARNWQEPLGDFVRRDAGHRSEALAALGPAMAASGRFSTRAVVTADHKGRVYARIADATYHLLLPPVIDVIERSFGIERIVSRVQPRPPRWEQYCACRPPSPWGVHISFGRGMPPASVGEEFAFGLGDSGAYLHDGKGLRPSGLCGTVWPFMWYVVWVTGEDVHRLKKVSGYGDRPHLSLAVLGYDGR